MRIILALAVMLAASGCVSKLAYPRVKSAMLDAGLSQGNASCMASRMTDKLTLGQLRKLEALSGEKRSLMDFVAAVRRVGDAEALGVTASSAALCTSGLVR